MCILDYRRCSRQSINISLFIHTKILILIAENFNWPKDSWNSLLCVQIECKAILMQHNYIQSQWNDMIRCKFAQGSACIDASTRVENVSKKKNKLCESWGFMNLLHKYTEMRRKGGRLEGQEGREFLVISVRSWSDLKHTHTNKNAQAVKFLQIPWVKNSLCSLSTPLVWLSSICLLTRLEPHFLWFTVSIGTWGGSYGPAYRPAAPDPKLHLCHW